MPKQLNVSLGFTADTSQARQQIQQLKQSLQELNVNTVKNNAFSKMSEDIVKAQQSVQKLASILDSSLNMNTGRLDLSKFNQQLGSAGMSIQSLATDMNALGAGGQKAFLNLANSIVTAQKPMMETNKLLDGMWTALQNTARWQLSSSLLHGFMGAIQGAYGYAQDLNKSLTDIAIVTGRSTDQMAAFAEQANKSAQALNVSTTAYTDAALIYYQQGLDDAAVKARTDITMMMSNVTGESAEHVSSYMTAIWNNFAEGSDNLEHFADVITALGAATASSSEEIANGMQQFAAVADTVGLSYEYAATALATVVAQTRQSESTVGNSFRTIFSRLQGLKLGDTLDDGTTLNKYSSALATIGVNIKDQNGELKDMDTILNEIGAKWQQLSKDQQVALAQTIGGVRQYTNLIALFDNWDTFQKNLDIANNSDGALQQQADIYAQSWEAAQKRVKAAWQAIYQDLIDSNFFIDLLNILEKVLKGIDVFIDSVGGIPGVLSVLGVAITGLFGDKILAGIQNAQQQLKVMTGVAQQEANYITEQTKLALDKLIPFGSEDSAEAMRVQSLKDQVDLNYQLKGAIEELAVGNKHLTESQREHLNSLIETTQQYGEAAAKAKEYQQAASTKLGDTRLDIKALMLDKGDITSMGYEHLTSILEHEQGNEAFDAFEKSTEKIASLQLAGNFEEAEKATSNYLATLSLLTKGSGATADQLKNLIKTTVDLKVCNEQSTNATKNYAAQLNSTKIQIEAEKRAVQENISIQEAQKAVIEENIQKVQENINNLEQKTDQTQEDTDAINENRAALERLNGMLGQINNAPTQNFNTGIYSPEFAQNLTNTITTISRVTMAVSSLKSAWDTLQNPDLTGWEKFTRVTTSLGMALPALIPIFSKLLIVSKANTIEMEKNTLATMENDLAKKISFLTMQGFTEEEVKEHLALEASAIAKKKDAIAALEDGTAHAGLTAMIKANTLAIWDNIKAMTAWLIAHPEILAIAAAIGAVVLVIKELHDASPEAVLEASNKKLEEASQKVNEATEAYQNLKSTLDEYQQVKKDINDIEDSQERQKAINEENEKILEMLHNTENWYDLIGNLEYDSNGLISLTEEQIKALENDKAREASLARQLKLQEQINNITANQDVEDSKYTGKKIMTSSAIGSKDITSDIAELFAQKGLGINSDEVAIKEALAEAGYSDAVINKIYSDIQRIVADEDSSRQFNEMQANHLQSIAEREATEKQINQEKINQAEAELGSGRISGISQYEDVRLKAAEAWNNLSEELKQKVLNGSLGLVEALDQAGFDLREAEKEAIKKLKEEAEVQRQTNINSIADQMTGVKLTDQQKTVFGTDDPSAYIKSSLQQLSSEDLKIALTLDLDRFQSVEELKKAIEEIKGDIEHELVLNVNAEDLSNYKGKTEDLEAEVQSLSDFIQENADKFKNLSEHMSECDAIADQFAYSLIRFDDALQDVEKNYKDWSKILRSTEKDILKTKEVTDALKKTYGNLLNIDGSQLSQDFLEDAENLDLMNDVLTGTEEEAIAAYDALAKIAAMDIANGQATKLGIEFDEAAFNSTWDTIMSEIDRLRLEAGDPIDMASPNFYPLVDGLNQMLALVGSDVEAAKALFAQLGFTAEFENVPVHKINREQNVPVTPEFEEKKSEPFIGVSGTESEEGLEFSEKPGPSAVAYGVRYAAEKATETQGKSTTNVSSLKIKDGSLHYIGGGSPKISNLPARTLDSGGGGGGGSCFAAKTLITIQNNYKNIEDIKVGDFVLSYNEKTKKNEYSKVVQTMIHNVYEKIYNLFIKNDKLIVTGNHRFLITRNNEQKWIQAADIQIGDFVLLANGVLYKISKIDIQKRFLTVYNFEVSNNHNYYVGENQVLAHNKGGGGKAKKKKVEKKKEPTKNIKEKDRYHNIKEKIEDLNTEMKRLSENKDRAYGKHRIKWMDEEIKKTEEQIKLTDEYIKEIKDYAKIDKDDLMKKLGSFISESDFDENGVLKDYEGLLAKIQGAFDDTTTKALNDATAAYNKAVDEFNASDQGDDATEAFDNAKEAWDKAKEAYDKDKETYDERLKALKQYEDTINLLQEKEQERIDQLNELYDKWLALTEYKVEISLDINDNDRKLLDWIYNHLGDKADKAADRIANLGQQLKTSQKDIATYVKGIEELFAQNGMNVSLDADNLDGKALGEELDKMIEKLRADGSEPNIQQVIDDMKEYRDGLMDTYDTMRDLVDEVTENVVNAYDEWNEKLSENLDLMDHYDTVIDTIKEIADLLGEDQLGLGDAQAEAYEAAKLKNQQNAAAIAKDNYDAIAKEREKTQALLDQAESETEKRHWEEVLKNLEESEKEAMEEYLARWRDALRQAEENYQASLERNEKAYKKALGGGLGSLDMLQEQIDRQKELNDLYLDDYEKYKKLGDITAKINKNLANNPSPKIQEKMGDLLDDINAKMEAGAEISEGEATILEKRLALLEAEDQLQAARNAKSAVRMTRDNEGNFSYTYTADTSKIEEAQQNYADKFYDLLDYERQYADEVQDGMLQSWQDFVNKRNEILEDDMLSEEERNKALARLKDDYDQMVSYYADELDMVISEMGRLKTEDWKDMEAILGRLLAAPDDFQTNYKDTVLGKITDAWEDPTTLKESWVDAVNSLYSADAKARADWVASNEETNRRVDTTTKQFAENYVGTLGEVVETSNEVAKSAEEMAAAMGPAMEEVLDEADAFFNDIGLYMDNLVENIKAIVSAINDLQEVLAGVDPEWQSKILGKLPEGSEKSNMAGYDTGGYTGAWGSSGKLAILHQKELVLNENDTKNILKAVDFIRNIPGAINGVNVNNTINYAPLAATGMTDLQQQVHIEASFPNVQSHNEIELALNNLINSASQYVNRK